MPGGGLFGTDYDVLRESVLRVCGRFEDDPRLNFLEIGVDLGGTACSLISEIDTHWRERFEYFGIDILPCPPSMPAEYTHIQEISHLVFTGQYGNDFGDGVSYPLHFIFLDSCHCAQCCLRDAIMWGSLLVPGGEMCFHDASPSGQRPERQVYPALYRHHDAIAADSIQVRRVLDANLLGGFKLVRAAADQDFGGVEVYEKL